MLKNETQSTPPPLVIPVSAEKLESIKPVKELAGEVLQVVYNPDVEEIIDLTYRQITNNVLTALREENDAFLSFPYNGLTFQARITNLQLQVTAQGAQHLIFSVITPDKFKI